MPPAAAPPAASEKTWGVEALDTSFRMLMFFAATVAAAGMLPALSAPSPMNVVISASVWVTAAFRLAAPPPTDTPSSRASEVVEEVALTFTSAMLPLTVAPERMPVSCFRRLMARPTPALTATPPMPTVAARLFTLTLEFVVTLTSAPVSPPSRPVTVVPEAISALTVPLAWATDTEALAVASPPTPSAPVPASMLP